MHFDHPEGRAAPLLVCLALAIFATVVSPPFATAQSADASDPGGLPGATVDELLVMGRRLNPGLAAAALEAQAAQARIGAAGKFPDPMFKTEFWDMRAARSSALPENVGTVKYSVEQTVPLWGKRELERKIARAEAGSAADQRRGVETELLARIKTVFASYYATNEAIGINQELLGSVAAVARVAESRYGQGRGNQQDVVTAEVERGRLQVELARLEGERRGWIAQLNALLNRPAGAPLATPRALRPIPQADALPLAELLERVHRDNPQLAAEQATITAAERNAELVRRNWYPDPTFGFTVFDEDGSNGRQFGGYEAMVSFAIPLQWGLRRAQEQEALAKAAASRTRREATAADLRGQLEQAWWGLDAARRGERILRDINIPQSDVVLQSALAGYELGRADLPSVLLAEQAVLRVTLDRIALLVEQQMRLAELERVIGGDL
ncbi:MAG: TolC family protein [Rhodospirillales bacterium]|nr:TolC family protein [Rhodospirillales bacterium]